MEWRQLAWSVNIAVGGSYIVISDSLLIILIDMIHTDRSTLSKLKDFAILRLARRNGLILPGTWLASVIQCNAPRCRKRTHRKPLRMANIEHEGFNCSSRYLLPCKVNNFCRHSFEVIPTLRAPERYMVLKRICTGLDYSTAENAKCPWIVGAFFHWSFCFPLLEKLFAWL